MDLRLISMLSYHFPRDQGTNCYAQLIKSIGMRSNVICICVFVFVFEFCVHVFVLMFDFLKRHVFVILIPVFDVYYYYPAKLIYLNFQLLEVMSRYRDPQPQSG